MFPFILFLWSAKCCVLLRRVVPGELEIRKKVEWLLREKSNMERNVMTMMIIIMTRRRGRKRGKNNNSKTVEEGREEN